jgi:hypothetical protein
MNIFKIGVRLTTKVVAMRILNTTRKGYRMGHIIDRDVSMGEDRPKLTIPMVRFDTVPI